MLSDQTTISQEQTSTMNNELATTTLVLQDTKDAIETTAVESTTQFQQVQNTQDANETVVSETATQFQQG
ncbi:unnamed protein product [Rotaria sp. Silwood1]|nr:unnamed protein product [Rotaria sp. Silwood1]